MNGPKKKYRLIGKVTSLRDLHSKAEVNQEYAKLLKLASENLGGRKGESLDEAYQNLINNANETDEFEDSGEQGVVNEVNGLRDLLNPV